VAPRWLRRDVSGARQQAGREQRATAFGRSSSPARAMNTGPGEDERFRSELVSFLEQNAPPEATNSYRSASADLVPDWARRWQATLFDHDWMIPSNPHHLVGGKPQPNSQFCTSRRSPEGTYPGPCISRATGSLRLVFCSSGPPVSDHWLRLRYAVTPCGASA
jgi:hypothetical protein